LSLSAANQEAVKRLYSLKHREQKPGTLVAANVEQLVALGRTKTLWPPQGTYGPIRSALSCRVNRSLLNWNLGKGDLAVRIPSRPELNRLLERTGPLLTSSANHPGEPPASNVTEAQAYFGDQVDFYVDGGDLSGRPPSTVARLTDGHLEVLRQGAVIIDAQGRLADKSAE
jgi:tRNA threonylcarbamoyl adenosine modification protein (Sua5/YciO/YrdC/YwlC family)